MIKFNFAFSITILLACYITGIGTPLRCGSRILAGFMTIFGVAEFLNLAVNRITFYGDFPVTLESYYPRFSGGSVLLLGTFFDCVSGVFTLS